MNVLESFWEREVFDPIFGCCREKKVLVEFSVSPLLSNDWELFIVTH
jgi:hypothetical protein